MPPLKKKTSKKSCKQPKNTRNTSEADLSRYIIRTRRQSQQERIEISNMADQSTECSQPCSVHDENYEKLEAIQEDALNFNSSTQVIESTLIASAVRELQRPESLKSAVTGEAYQHVEENVSSLSVTRGKVAVMVDKLNKTPQSSPVSSPQRKGNMAVNNQEAAYPQLSEVIKNLVDTTTTLNQSVTQLQQEISTLRSEKAQQDTQVSDLSNAQSTERRRLREALDMIALHEKRFEALVGIMSHQNEEIAGLKKVLSNMAVRSMRHNIIISGLVEQKNENITWSVLEFFKSKLKIEENIAIVSAYRIGNGAERSIVVELAKLEDKAKIYHSVSKLKGVKNSNGKSYFISDQLPEVYAERRRQQSYIKAQNNKLPSAQQMDMSFKKGELFVGSERYVPPVVPPTIRQRVMPTAQERAIQEQVEIFEGDSRDRHDSVFLGYAARVNKKEQVDGAYRKIRQIHPDATHVMCAFRFPGHDPTRAYGLADDGEHGGARRILNAITADKLYNLAVFVVRYYGGRNIGPDRFQFIETVAKSAIDELRDHERPRSIPWNDQIAEQQQDSNNGTSITSPFDPNEPGLPNKGRASMLNPEYLRGATTSRASESTPPTRSQASSVRSN